MTQPNSNGVTDRRSASAKRSTDVSANRWPVVTNAVYQSIHNQAPADMDPKVRQLCLMRVRLGQALLACDTITRKPLQKEDKKLFARLRSIRERLAKVLQEDFPLEIR